MIIGIFAMSVAPFSLAWFLAEHPEYVRLGSSNGDLIKPPVTTELREFTGIDAFSADNLRELSGHWVLLTVGGEDCGPVCLESLYKARQLSLMFGKDVPRIRRGLLLTPAARADLPPEWADDGRLLKLRADAKLLDRVRAAGGKESEAGAMLLMDPLGNIMMRYAAGYDPYRVRNDLTKLLKISQIG